MLALVLGVVLAGCGDDEDSGGGGGGEATSTPAADVEKFDAGTPLGDIQEKGEIVIGVKYDVPPFGFNNPSSGKVEGFDVELGQAVADKLGVKPKFIEAISDNRIPFLEDGTADMILSTMTINEERDGQIEFSDPYYIAKGRILVKKDNSEITGVDSLAGKNVCTALGSTYEATLKKQAPDAKLKLVDSYSECLESLQNGSVDAISTDDVILTGMIIQDDSLKLVGDELSRSPTAPASRRATRSSRSSSTASSRSTRTTAATTRPTRSGSASTPTRRPRRRRSPSTRRSSWSSRTRARNRRACPSPSSTR